MSRLLLLGAGGPVSAAVSYTDDFNRANENLEANANWTRIDGTAGAAQVVSNRMEHTSATETSYKFNPLSSVDAYAQVVVVTVSNGITFPVVARLADLSNLVGARYNSGAWQLYKRVTGTFTQLATFTATLAANDVLKLEVTGDNARVLVNGSQVIGWTSLGGSLSSNALVGTLVRSSVFDYDSWECGSL